jgi:hypothetical protein
MKVRDQDQALSALATETIKVAKRIGGWVSLRAGPESYNKRKISFFKRDSIPRKIIKYLSATSY